MRGEVEAALADHFGRPVPLTLVVDPGAGGAARSTGSPARRPARPPAAEHPTAAHAGRTPARRRHRPVAETPGTTVTEDDEDLAAFDESELGEVAEIDNSAEPRVLQAFPGAEEVV